MMAYSEQAKDSRHSSTHTVKYVPQRCLQRVYDKHL